MMSHIFQENIFFMSPSPFPRFEIPYIYGSGTNTDSSPSIIDGEYLLESIIVASSTRIIAIGLSLQGKEEKRQRKGRKRKQRKQQNNRFYIILFYRVLLQCKEIHVFFT